MGESDRKLPVNDYSNIQENLSPALVKNHCTQTFNTLMFTCTSLGWLHVLNLWSGSGTLRTQREGEMTLP